MIFSYSVVIITFFVSNKKRKCLFHKYHRILFLYEITKTFLLLLLLLDVDTTTTTKRTGDHG